MGVSGNRSIELAHSFRGIDHQQRDIGCLQMLSRHHHGKLFRHEVGLALPSDAGCVDEAKTSSVALKYFIYRIPGRSWDRGHNRPVGSGQAIKQGRLAHVWVSYDGDLD